MGSSRSLNLPICGMTLDRYLRLPGDAGGRAAGGVDWPAAAHAGFSRRGSLGMQNEIADRIVSGEAAKWVAREVLHRLTRRRLPHLTGTPAAAEYRKLLTTARRVLRIVAGRHEASGRRLCDGGDRRRANLAATGRVLAHDGPREALALQTAIDDLRARVLRP